MDGSARRFHRAMSATVVMKRLRGAIISSRGHLNRINDRKSRPGALQNSRLIHSSLSLVASRRAALLHPPWGMWRCEAKLRRVYEQRAGLGMLRKIAISLKPPVAKAATCVVVSFDLREGERERGREKKWSERTTRVRWDEAPVHFCRSNSWALPSAQRPQYRHESHTHAGQGKCAP